MLTHPTLDQLNQLGLFGMAKAFDEVAASGDAAALPHLDWLALLLDREMTYRHDRKLTARLRYARLRHQAAIEDVDYRATRGLDRALFQKLAEGCWIDAHDNVILSGPTGVGKVGSPALSDTELAVTTDPFSISAFPSSSPISRWHAATVVTPDCCGRSGACNSLY